MSFYGEVELGDALILHHKPTDTLVKAISEEDRGFGMGSFACLDVRGVRGLEFPVEAMTINVNYWDVYKMDNPKVTALLGARVFGESE